LVASGKGGVGKSTCACLTGIALARRGKTVLLLELDFSFRCLDFMLGVQDSVVFDLEDIFIDKTAVQNAIVPTPANPNLFLISCPVSGDSAMYKNDISELLLFLKRHFDFVIVDCPAGEGPWFRMAARAATGALIVATAEPSSVRDARVISDILDSCGVADQRLIINKLSRYSYSRDTFANLDVIIDSVGIRLIGVVPADEQIHELVFSTLPPAKSLVWQVFNDIAARLLGEERNLRMF